MRVLYEFIHNPESVTQIIYAWPIIPHNQKRSNLNLGWLIVRINFHA